MFDIGFGEMVLLAAIALIAIGPKQLPGVARSVGKLLGEFKKTFGAVTSGLNEAQDSTAGSLRKITDDVNNSIRSSLDSRPVGHHAQPEPEVPKEGHRPGAHEEHHQLSFDETAEKKGDKV